MELIGNICSLVDLNLKCKGRHCHSWHRLCCKLLEKVGPRLKKLVINNYECKDDCSRDFSRNGGRHYRVNFG